MKGKVYLIGAGPGDYGLMTLKGMEIIRKADVVYYDRLANPAYLKEVKKSCELIYAGKESSNHSIPQEEINKQLAAKAKEGKIVARLKGGDPYVFGRGGEEGELLFEEGIDFEVVPGITSAIGGLCYAGIPITHRDYASSFHVFTAHLKDEVNSLDWKTISALEGTLVFLMGVSNLKLISEKLIIHGKDSCTPAAIVNWATRSNQRAVTGTLEDIYEKAVNENIKPPSLIVVGEVVKLRDKLNFFEKTPLFGRNIIVTRAREQSSTLVAKIAQLGGNAIEIPSIRIREIPNNVQLETSIEDIHKFKYLIFTSVNGVEIFFKKLYAMKKDSRTLFGVKLVTIGSATGEALRKYGLMPDIVPERFISEAIVESLKPFLNKEDNILIPRAKEAREYLTEALKELCNVTEVKTYETVIDESEKDKLLELANSKEIDYITFTSSSTVENFVALLGGVKLHLMDSVKLISIGPETSKTLTKHGLKIYKEAEEYNIDGVVQCLVEQ